MKEELTERISKDLNINRFERESENEFHQRLIYSAAAMWVKTLIFGNSINELGNENEEKFPDIMYVQTHLKKVLDAYLKCFDLNQDWLEARNNKNEKELHSEMAHVIIREMIDIFEIGQINGRELCAVPIKYVKYGGWSRVFGGYRFCSEICSIGVAQWSVNFIEHSVDDTSRIISANGRNYYNTIVENFPWKRMEISPPYDIFKVGNLNTYSKSWFAYRSDNLQQGIYLLRKVNQFEKAYLLIKKAGEEISAVVLDPWYSETGDIYRIMYALNEQNNSKAQFRAKDYGDYLILKYASALPDYENRIIHSLSWPYRDYADNYERVIPKTAWHIVEELIKNIGAEIVY